MQLEPFKLERYFAEYEFTSRYLLCCSDCESVAIKDLLALEPDAREDFDHCWLGYTESPGAVSLRQEIAKIYQTICPEHLLVHTGAEEAIFLFMQAVLQPGDHVIIHWPCYQSLFEIARSIGCEVTLWQAREENGWALAISDLEKSIKPNTKAVVLNTPHNPTGYLMALDDFKAVNTLAEKYGLVLFSDEVYRESEYNLADRLPAACDINEQAVSLGVMSKTYGLPGLRIGWVATHNDNVYRRMAMLKDYTTICNSAPSEFLSELALRHRHQLAQRNLEIIQSNLTILSEFFSKYSERFVWQPPKAGAIAFPKLIGVDIATFCRDLVDASGVLLLPGTLYGDQDNHFRIGFGRKNMPEALNRFSEFLDKREG